MDLEGEQMKLFRGCLVVVVAVLLSACAEKFVLTGSPEVGGLLVIDPTIRSKSFMGQESEPPVVNVVIRKVVGDLLIEGEPLKGVFVFQGLKPGEYQLISFSTKPGKKEVVLTVPPDEEELLSFRIEAGKPLFLGEILARQDMHMKELGVHFALIPDTERERAAWEMLLEQSLRSQWKLVIEKYLATLS